MSENMQQKKTVYPCIIVPHWMIHQLQKQNNFRISGDNHPQTAFMSLSLVLLCLRCSGEITQNTLLHSCSWKSYNLQWSMDQWTLKLAVCCGEPFADLPAELRENKSAVVFWMNLLINTHGQKTEIRFVDVWSWREVTTQKTKQGKKHFHQFTACGKMSLKVKDYFQK